MLEAGPLKRKEPVRVEPTLDHPEARPVDLSKFEAAIVPGPEQLKIALIDMKAHGEPGWEAFKENPVALAEEVRGYAELIERPERNESMKIFRHQLEKMSPEQFDAFVSEMILAMLALSQARLELAFGLEGTIEESVLNLTEETINQRPDAVMLQKLVTEIRHQDEVIRLAAAMAEPLRKQNRFDYFLTLVAAAGHDIDKYSRKPDVNGTLRQFKNDPADNLEALFQHELVSAADLACFSDIDALRQLAERFGLSLPEEWFQVVAATAAGHGEGEFPEKMARTGFMNPKAERQLPYYRMVLVEEHLPSVIVHLADFASGTFGKERTGLDGTTMYGLSFYKYFLVHIQQPTMTLEASIASSLATTAEGVTEVQRLLLSLEANDQLSALSDDDRMIRAAVREQIRAIIDEYVGAATAFQEWARQLPTDTPEKQTIDTPLPDAAVERQSLIVEKSNAMQRLLTSFSRGLTPKLIEAGRAQFTEDLPGMITQRLAVLKSLERTIIDRSPETQHPIPLGITSRQVEEGAEQTAEKARDSAKAREAAEELYLRRTIAQLEKTLASLK